MDDSRYAIARSNGAYEKGNWKPFKSGNQTATWYPPRHPHDHGPKNEMQRRLPPHLQHSNKQAPQKSQCKINSDEQAGLKKGCKKNDPASSKGSRKDKCKKECSSKKGK